MKKYGKYENKPEGVPVKQTKVRSALLQTYLTSLLCMVLCVTMFFGTSYAWFSSEVTNEGNEIYIGTLDVDLQDKAGNSLAGNANPLFTDSVHWEPGYTALETVKVVDEGDLAFRYELTLKEDANSQLGGMALNDVAKWFDVWCYHDVDNAVPTPANYGQITEANGWTKVGSLDEVLAGKVVFRGSMTEAEVTADTAVAHTYTIALHMNGEEVAESEQAAFNTLMGKSIVLNVKLVATQLSSEDDAFGNGDYDSSATPTCYVTNTAELLDTLTKAAEGDIVVMRAGEYIIGEDNKLQITTAHLTLKGEGADKTIIKAGTTACQGQAALYVSADDVTVCDLMIASEGTPEEGKTYSKIDAIKVSDLNNPSGIVRNVTLRNLIVSSNGSGVNLHGVNNAVVDGVKVEKFSKCGFSLANAKGVKFTNCVTTEQSGAWADIGCMYKENDEAYQNPCEFAFDDTNTFGNGAIYSERPETAAGGLDTATYPAEWTYLPQTGSHVVWVLTNKTQGNAG